MEQKANDYVTGIQAVFSTSAAEVNAQAWDDLLSTQTSPTPFMQHAYLAGLEHSGCVGTDTGWTPVWVCLYADGELQAGSVLYLKTHSYGEYVFDWAWAQAYHRHGLDYYPKALVAVPFTPVPGNRLLARNAHLRQQLLQTLLDWCHTRQLSSLHLLFTATEDQQAAATAGLMQRHTVQFHWTNCTRNATKWQDFDDFLSSLTQEKRKKIRQERRRVAEAGVQFRWSRGAEISTDDWALFYRCYERTYLAHGNPPYLTPAFFQLLSQHQAEAWLMFVAEKEGRPIATSLIAINDPLARGSRQFDTKTHHRVAYGRYWGSLEPVDCLHFEACYYQPLIWCITHGFDRFEGGAQGEHKMARALMPTRTISLHWLAHPGFAQAVDHFLEQEGQHVNLYLQDLAQRSPLKST